MFKSMRECSEISERSTSECKKRERKKEVMKWKGNDKIKHIMKALWGPAGVELLCCKCVSER